ncbi:hypothetical protein K439DRAFT_1619530 [Ramaria rubella]|nr:hypothetical protein K439DRAFT_1619530 [Ramaria rubella]
MSSEHQSFEILGKKVVSRVIVSAAVSYVLDYTLIFSREVTLVWRKKASLGGVLYFSARYSLGIFITLSLCNNFLLFPLKVTLLGIYPTCQLIYSACSRFYDSQKNNGVTLRIRICTSVKILSGIGLVTCQLSLQTMLTIRAYAISNRCRYILAILYVDVDHSMAFFHPLDVKISTGTLSCEEDVYGTLATIIASAAIIIFDAVLIGVTFYYTRELRRLQADMGSDKKRLTSLLIQQGLLRFWCVIGEDDTPSTFNLFV